MRELNPLKKKWNGGVVKNPWVSCAMLSLVILLVGACNRKEESGRGKGALSQSGRRQVTQTTTPRTAPLAQPQYNEVGNATTSRIVTNAAGQKGLSIRETNDLPPSPSQNGDDQALSQRVRVALSTGTTGTQGTYPSESLLDIGVRATNGVVTLTGTVGDQVSKEALARRARAVEGVRGVINQLEISSTAPSSLPRSPAGRRQEELPHRP